MDASQFAELRAQYLVETAEVEVLIASAPSNLRLVNATFPVSSRDSQVEQRLTASTQYFSVAEVSQPGSDLPNTLPTAAVFSEHMRRLRIGKDCQIIVYDHSGMQAVARAAWMFQFFGASNVRIMNGGLQKWLAEGRSVY